MGRRAVQNMVSIWQSRGMSLGLKVSFLRATAFPIALYGCESWAMTSGDKKRVDAFEMWCYRRLLRVSWMERKIGSVFMLRKSMAVRGQTEGTDRERQRGREREVEGERERGEGEERERETICMVQYMYFIISTCSITDVTASQTCIRNHYF